MILRLRPDWDQESESPRCPWFCQILWKTFSDFHGNQAHPQVGVGRVMLSPCHAADRPDSRIKTHVCNVPPTDLAHIYEFIPKNHRFGRHCKGLILPSEHQAAQEAGLVQTAPPPHHGPRPHPWTATGLGYFHAVAFLFASLKNKQKQNSLIEVAFIWHKIDPFKWVI